MAIGARLVLAGGYSDNGIGATAGRNAATYFEQAIKNGQKAFSDLEERDKEREEQGRVDAAEQLLRLSEKRPLTEEDYRLAGRIDGTLVREAQEEKIKRDATINHWQTGDRNNDPVLLSAIKREEMKFNIANGFSPTGRAPSTARSSKSSSYKKGKSSGLNMNLKSAADMYTMMGLDDSDAIRLATLRTQRQSAGEDPTVVDRYIQEKGEGGILWGDVDMPNTGDWGAYGTDYSKLKEELGRYAVQSQLGPDVYN